jgi:predicted transcriptional regulator
MTKDLLHILTASDKRKDILLLLSESPRTLSEFKDYFIVTSPEILPRLKEMEAANLILKQDGFYQLSPLGEIIAEKYKLFLNTISAIEENQEFWNTHDISAIPKGLLSRIQEIKECKVVKTKEWDESNPIFVYNIKNAQKIVGATCIFHSTWTKPFIELAIQGIPIKLILTSPILNKIKNEYTEELKTLLKQGVKFYLYDNLKTSFTVTESFFSLSLESKTTNSHDVKNDLQGSDKPSIKWGEDLFNYYLNESIEIDEVLSMDEQITQKEYGKTFLI